MCKDCFFIMLLVIFLIVLCHDIGKSIGQVILLKNLEKHKKRFGILIDRDGEVEMIDYD